MRKNAPHKLLRIQRLAVNGVSLVSVPSSGSRKDIDSHRLAGEEVIHTKS